MHHQFNIQQLYALPTLYLCVLYLSENQQLKFKVLFKVFKVLFYMENNSVPKFIFRLSRFSGI